MSDPECTRYLNSKTSELCEPNPDPKPWRKPNGDRKSLFIETYLICIMYMLNILKTCNLAGLGRFGFRIHNIEK